MLGISGTFKDPRDGQVYPTTTIGSQTWMVENLRYNVPGGSWDYNDDKSITMGAGGNAPYGKLYSWEAVEEAVLPAGIFRQTRSGNGWNQNGR